jgi:hypothetical protein
MAEFTVNAHRFNPYMNFKFGVRWDGQLVAGSTRSVPSSGRRRWFPTGTAPTQLEPESVGRTEYDAVTSSAGGPRRGVRHGGQQGVDYGSGPATESSLRDFRKDIVMSSTRGRPARHRYKIYGAGCRSSGAARTRRERNAVAIQTLKLENEGW